MWRGPAAKKKPLFSNGTCRSRGNVQCNTGMTLREYLLITGQQFKFRFLSPQIYYKKYLRSTDTSIKWASTA